MSKRVYEFKQASSEQFELYESGLKLVTFDRASFRSSLEKLSRGSNWIGSMLRMFLKAFPPSLPPYFPSVLPLERILRTVGQQGIVDYLRHKGLRVSRALNVPDRDLILYLESEGYVIEGVIDGVYYATEQPVSSEKAPDSVGIS